MGNRYVYKKRHYLCAKGMVEIGIFSHKYLAERRFVYTFAIRFNYNNKNIYG